MAQRTIFYSWQSDLPNGTNRTFIENCLNKAIKELLVAHPKLDPCLDRDTAGVPGSPDIAATILDKIKNCEIFVCDVSNIQGEKRQTPNPNVLVELGYAIANVGWDRIICICNTHFGKVEDLPFDIRQRRVRTYSLADDGTNKADVAKDLTTTVKREIESILMAARSESDLLQLQFGDIDTKTPIGQKLYHTTVYYSTDYSTIPDYTAGRSSGPLTSSPALGKVNPDFNRQYIEYLQFAAASKKTAFVVFNGTGHSLNDVTLEFAIRKGSGLTITAGKPWRPAATISDYGKVTPLRDYFARPGRLSVKDLNDRYEVTVQFLKIQAEANAWSEPMYVSARESCNFAMRASLFADELSAPKEVSLEISFQINDVPFGTLTKEDVNRIRVAFEDSD